MAPAASTSAPSRLTSASSVVLISNHILSDPRPASTPSLASMTSLLAAGEGRQVITRSTACVNALGDSAQVAPFMRKGAAASLSKSRTTRSKLLRCRLPANLLPTLPSPIKPIFICEFSETLIDIGY